VTTEEKREKRKKGGTPIEDRKGKMILSGAANVG